MKRLLVWNAWCALALILPAGSAAAQVRLAPEKIADGVWVTATPGGANVGWFLMGDSVMAIDSGANPKAGRLILDAIQRTAGKPVHYLVVTHAHADHAGGAPVFAAAGAQVICAENAAPGVLAVLQTASAPAGAEATPPPRRSSRTSAGRTGAGASPTRGVLTVSERMLFAGGPRRVEIYYLGPAHTRGDLVIALPEERILFSGDIAVNGVIPYVRAADVDPAGWERLLPRLASLRIDKLVPGHGEIGPVQGITDTLAYLRRANEISRKLVESGVGEEGVEKYFYVPENVIENVRVTPEHIENMKAIFHLARLRAQTPTGTPAAPGTPAATPVMTRVATPAGTSPPVTPAPPRTPAGSPAGR